MHTMSHRLNVTNRLLLCGVFAALALISPGARAASIGSGGYSTDFGTQPIAADWTSLSIAGAAGDITAANQMDTAVQNVSAASVSAALGVDGGNPPAISGLSLWSSSGFYVQTRPTANGATVLMCTLVNNLGV